MLRPHALPASAHSHVSFGTVTSMSNRDYPPPRLIRTWQDAEDYAAEYVAWLGWSDARATRRSGDDGIDVQGTSPAGTVVAQVKMEVKPVESKVIRELRGAGVPVGANAFIIFALAGYTPPAISWSQTAGVALFEFAYDGSISPVNALATTLVSNQSGDAIGRKTSRSSPVATAQPAPPRPTGLAAELRAHDLTILQVIENWEREDRTQGHGLYHSVFNDQHDVPYGYVLQALPTLRKFLNIELMRERGTVVGCTIKSIKPAGVKALRAWGLPVQPWR